MVLLGLAAACAPAAPEAAPEPAGPLPGDDYAYVYTTPDAIVRHDTRTGRDRTVAREVAEVLVSAASADGSGVAVAYRGGSGTRVVVVDLGAGTAVEVHRGDPGTTYTEAPHNQGYHHSNSPKTDIGAPLAEYFDEFVKVQIPHDAQGGRHYTSSPNPKRERK